MPSTVVAVCMHKTCRRHGSGKVHARLSKQLEKWSTAPIRVEKRGCLGSCGGGCSVLIAPQGVTVTKVRPRDVKDLVRRQLTGGEPLKGLPVEFRCKRKGRKAARRLVRAAFAA